MSEWTKAAPGPFRRDATTTDYLRDSGLVSFDLAQTAPRSDAAILERPIGRTVPYPAPSENARQAASLSDILSARRSEWPRAGRERLHVPTVMARTFGTVRVGVDGHHHRAYPSASRAYAVHAHVFAPAIDDSVIGRYDPRGHGLHEVVSTSASSLDALTPQTRFGYRTFADAGAAIFLVGDIAALSGRYGALALRLLLLEAGHIGGLLQLVCTELGGTALPMGGFYDDEVATALSLDAGQHCLYVWVIG